MVIVDAASVSSALSRRVSVGRSVPGSVFALARGQRHSAGHLSRGMGGDCQCSGRRRRWLQRRRFCRVLRCSHPGRAIDPIVERLRIRAGGPPRPAIAQVAAATPSGSLRGSRQPRLEGGHPTGPFAGARPDCLGISRPLRARSLERRPLHSERHPGWRAPVSQWLGPGRAGLLDDPGGGSREYFRSGRIHLRRPDRAPGAAARRAPEHRLRLAVQLHAWRSRRHFAGGPNGRAGAGAGRGASRLGWPVVLWLPGYLASRPAPVQRGRSLTAMRRYLIILGLFVRTEVQREIEYRANLLMEVVQMLLVVGSSVGAVLVLFSYTTALNSWTQIARAHV